jgi:hypothetical protein
MFQNFQPSISGRYPTSLKTLKTLCQKARSLEEMIHSWCDKKRSVLISRDFNGASPLILVSFFIRRRLLGSVEIDLDILLEQYPKANPLEVTSTPSTEMFNERQARLGLYFATIDQSKEVHNAAPADSIGELIVSYAMSGYGFAEIRMLPEDSTGIAKFMELKLITINPVTKVGWTENFLVARKDLDLLIAAQHALASGILH